MTEPPRRSTKQRSAISRALDEVRGFRTAQDMHALLRRKGSRVGLTTVYRNLQALAEAGEVDVVVSGEGEAMYRRCATNDHHHHLVCRECGTSVEVQSTDVEKWASRVARRHGFSQATHTAEIYGLCRSCS